MARPEVLARELELPDRLVDEAHLLVRDPEVVVGLVVLGGELLLDALLELAEDLLERDLALRTRDVGRLVGQDLLGQLLLQLLGEVEELLLVGEEVLLGDGVDLGLLGTEPGRRSRPPCASRPRGGCRAARTRRTPSRQAPGAPGVDSRSKAGARTADLGELDRVLGEHGRRLLGRARRRRGRRARRRTPRTRPPSPPHRSPAAWRRPRAERPARPRRRGAEAASPASARTRRASADSSRLVVRGGQGLGLAAEARIPGLRQQLDQALARLQQVGALARQREEPLDRLVRQPVLREDLGLDDQRFELLLVDGGRRGRGSRGCLRLRRCGRARRETQRPAWRAAERPARRRGGASRPRPSRTRSRGPWAGARGSRPSPRDRSPAPGIRARRRRGRRRGGRRRRLRRRADLLQARRRGGKGRVGLEGSPVMRRRRGRIPALLRDLAQRRVRLGERRSGCPRPQAPSPWPPAPGLVVRVGGKDRLEVVGGARELAPRRRPSPPAGRARRPPCPARAPARAVGSGRVAAPPRRRPAPAPARRSERPRHAGPSRAGPRRTARGSPPCAAPPGAPPSPRRCSSARAASAPGSSASRRRRARARGPSGRPARPRRGLPASGAWSRSGRTA